MEKFLVSFEMNCKYALLSVLSFALFGLSGCGGPVSCHVSGNVSYQGEPIKDGQIIFAAADGLTATAAIINGGYELDVAPGEATVRITASKETGRMVKGAMGAEIPERIDLIPPKYNRASTLKRTVDAKAEQTLDFELE
jgi:hypothetical protein